MEIWEHGDFKKKKNLITIGEGGFECWLSPLKILKNIDWLNYKSFGKNEHKDSYVKEITI